MSRALSGRLAPGLILLGILLLILGTFFLTRANPFGAVVVLRIEQEEIKSIIALTNSHAILDYPTEDETEILQSKRILYQVVTNLNLNRKWERKRTGDLGTDAACAQLKRQISLGTSGNGWLTEIRVWNEDEKEAAAIANELADFYRNERLADVTSTIRKRLKPQEEELERLNDAITNKQSEIIAAKKGSGAEGELARTVDGLEQKRQSLNLAILSEEIGHSMGRHKLIALWERACPPLHRRYSKPYLALPVCIAALGSIALGTALRRRSGFGQQPP